MAPLVVELWRHQYRVDAALQRDFDTDVFFLTWKSRETGATYAQALGAADWCNSEWREMRRRLVVILSHAGVPMICDKEWETDDR